MTSLSFFRRRKDKKRLEHDQGYTVWFVGGREWVVAFNGRVHTIYDDHGNPRGTAESIEKAKSRVDLLTNCSEGDRLKELEALEQIDNMECC